VKNLKKAYERTDEQHAIHNAVLNGSDKVIIVEAGSGTGKTSITLDIAYSLQRNNLTAAYLVFNQHNAEEARQLFPHNTKVSTINSMAYYFMRIHEKYRKIGQLYPSTVAQTLNISEKQCGLNRAAYCSLIINCVTNFCNSAESEFSKFHVPGNNPETPQTELQSNIVEHSKQLFRIIRPENSTQLPLPHHVYLKAWQLNNAPGIESYDLVLLDEAQDSSPVTIAILQNAKALFLVGDENQAIYSFRGAQSALQKFKGLRLPLSLSFRFGQEIADLANTITRHKNGYKGIKPLRGLPSLSTRITNISLGQKHTRIFRTNQDLVFSAKFLTDQMLPISIVGDMSDLAGRLLSGWALRNGENHYKINHPLISQYSTWSKFEEYALKNEHNEISQTYRIIIENDRRTPDIIRLLTNPGHANSKVQLVTGHRSKGLEFNDVVLSSDFDRFLEKGPSQKNWDEEMNLLYVSVTRAMRTLDVKSQFVKSLI
jgi:hypothetical protein